MENKIPTIFSEHFSKTIVKVCDDLKNQSKQIINIIPNLTNVEQVSKQTEDLLNNIKKELDSSFQLLYQMTHDSDGFTVVQKKKKRSKKNTVYQELH